MAGLILNEFWVPTAECWFWPEGQAYTVGDSANGGTGPGTAGKTSKPGATDPLWNQRFRMGCVSAGSIKSESDQTDVYCANGAALVRAHTYRIKQKLSAEFTSQEVDPISVQLAFGSQTLTVGTVQFNPLVAPPFKNGWLKLQLYNQNSALLRMVADLWGQLALPNGLPFDQEGHMECAFTFDVLVSPLSTISVS
jgi:hypothetical protein